MSKKPALINILKIGLITAATIIIYQISDLLLIYKYFRFEYYITGIALTGLITGILIRKKVCRNGKPA